MSALAGRTCATRGFKALMTAQFLGAFNDQLLKVVVWMLITNRYGPDQATTKIALANGLFVVPFLFFSPYAGFMADRFSKTRVLQITKVIEVLVTAVGAYLLVYGHFSGLLAVLFLMGLHSAFFSPAKYGILPEMLDREQLSKGNGYLEFWTFLALISGTTLGGMLLSLDSNSGLVPGLAILTAALIGFAASLFLPHTQAASLDAKFHFNLFSDLIRTLGEISRNKSLFLVLVAISYFWFAASLFQQNALLYAKHMVAVGNLGSSFLLAALAVGIGIGSIIAGVVSEGKVELGLVPLGALGMGLFSAILGFSYHSSIFSGAVLFCLGISGGFFIVPLNAFLQENSPLAARGRYIASSNFCTFSAMLLSSAVLWIFEPLNEAEVFLALGVISAGVAIMVCRTLPEILVRCVNWVLVHVVYRVQVIGGENIPKEGGALLVCNHVSYVDPPLLLAAVKRSVRFVMQRSIYQAKLIHPFARTMKAIPIDSAAGPKKILEALGQAREAIEQGELVVIFAEGRISLLGQMLPFQKGLERIVRGLDVPVIPVYLDEVWGSIFSFQGGKFFWKRPRELPYPVTIVVGGQLPSSVKAAEVRKAVQELGSEAFRYRRIRHKLLHLGFLSRAKRQPFRTCVADSSGKNLNYLAVAVSAFLLRKKILSLSLDETMVGVLLPPSIAGLIANLSVLLAGRVPVNLNYTSGDQGLQSAINQCQMKTVITSGKFLEKVQCPLGTKKILVEEVFDGLSHWEKLNAAFCFLLLPEFLIKYLLGRSGTSIEAAPGVATDSLATVIFSSGSTGEPKGVMLSHRNIASNISALYDVFQLSRHDCFLGVLPFFHSFGFTGTLWLPLLAGVKVVYHYNPIDGAVIGELAAKHRATVLMATPTFLLAYLRKCTRAQFQSLRYVVVGAEKLKEKVAEAFFERFGHSPLEGYGCTELSPVAMMNIPNREWQGEEQVGQKLGSVGHPIPGVAVKVVDPESYQALPPNQEGLLLVKGPNVMVGYLGNPEKTASVVKDGWYVTGDIAVIDDDGFVTITDRLSRFSKIGGEMVPHQRVEEEIQRILGAVDQVCVVTGIPDEKKGEKLIVLYTVELDPVAVISLLSDVGLPNLWIPKKESFFKIESIPLLGSGKLDLKKIKDQAQLLAREM